MAYGLTRVVEMSDRLHDVQLSLFDAPAPPVIFIEPGARRDHEIESLIDEIGALRAMNPYADPAYDPMEEWGLIVWGM